MTKRGQGGKGSASRRTPAKKASAEAAPVRKKKAPVVAAFDYFVRIPEHDPQAAPPRMAVNYCYLGRAFHAGDPWYGPLTRSEALQYKGQILHKSYAPVFEIRRVPKGEVPKVMVVIPQGAPVKVAVAAETVAPTPDAGEALMDAEDETEAVVVAAPGDEAAETEEEEGVDPLEAELSEEDLEALEEKEEEKG